MLETFRKDAKGGVAVIFALSIVPVLALVGTAVDFSRITGARAQTQKLLDSAVVAAVSLDASVDREAVARRHVEAQASLITGVTISEVVPVESVDDTTGQTTLHISARGRLDRSFVKLLGLQPLGFAIESEAVTAVRHYEVVLVVDVTGSMKGSKINALRRSAKTFVETLFPDGKPPLPSEASSKAVAASGRGTAPVDRRIRVAIVPYSATVNIGTDRGDWLAPSPGALDAIVQNRYVFSAAEVSKADCDGTNVTFDQQKGLCYIGELETWTGPGPCPGVESGGICYVANGWAGCVMERAGTAEELTDATPATRGFMPYYWPSYGGLGGGSDAYNSWLPNDINESWNTNANTNNGRGPNLGCPKNPIVPFTNDRDLLLGEIKDFEAWHRGGTMGHIGMVWGWRMLSPSWRDAWGTGAYPHDYAPGEVEKIVVFMTDGANGFYTGHAPSGDSDYTAYGRLSDTTEFDRGNHHDELNDRMETVCASMKARGIEIFTVGFSLSSASAQALLGGCATSPDHVFTSNTSTLEAHFQEIAANIAARGVAITR